MDQVQREQVRAHFSGMLNEDERQHDNIHYLHQREQELDEELDNKQDENEHQDLHQVREGYDKDPDLVQEHEPERLDQEQEQDCDEEKGQSAETSQETGDGSMVSKKRKRKGIYLCSECKDSFPSQKSLSKHIRSHKLTCVVCEKLFTLPVEFQGHMREHEGEEMPYWCDKCDKKYAKLFQLQNHRNICGRFECSECGHVFVRKDNFKEHMAVHADSNRSKCEICGKQFASATYKRRHMIMHRDETPFECVVCDERFKFKKNLKYHMRKHTLATNKYTKEFECVVCEQMLKGVNGLKVHMNIHKGYKEFKCKVCDKQFTQASSRDGHERTHYNKTFRFGKKPSDSQLNENVFNSFDCHECLLSFTKRRFLDDHARNTHRVIPYVPDSARQAPYFQCRLCSKSVKSSAKLNAHYLGEHCHVMDSSTENNGTYAFSSATRVVSPSTRCDGEVISSALMSDCGIVSPLPKPNGHRQHYGCKICNKKVTATTVANHFRNHGEKKFVCRVCGMLFVHMTTLKRHMTIHTHEKHHARTVCEQTFRTLENIKRHKTSHEGMKKTVLVKKYRCETCRKMFMDNYHLNRHKMTHMQKYRCGKCKLRFVDVKLYERHMQTHSAV